MGVEQTPRMRQTIRRRISNFLMPPEDLTFYRQIDDQIEGMILKLQRSEQKVKGLTEDIGVYKPTTWANLTIGDYNPEEIGYDEYKKMLDYDAQVIAGFDIIQMGVLMKPWKIVHEDEEIVKTLTDSLDRMRWPTFRDAMKQMMLAIPYGFTATELVFDDYKNFWMPRRLNALKTFNPEQIVFYTDPPGNLLKVEQRISGERISLPLDRTLIWSHEKQWGNWYGKSILRGCYKNWFIKDSMLKFANIAYERFGSPILLGVSSTLKDMVTIGEAIEHLFARSQAVIRRGDEKDPTDIKVLESKRAEMPFERYIRYQDEMILRRMLIGEPIFSGGGSTYSSKVPLDLLMMRFEDFRLELIGVMNDMLQIITDLNWSVDVYPKLSFAPLTTLDQAAIFQKIFTALDKGLIYTDEPWVRTELHFPAPSDEVRKRLEETAQLPREEEKEEEIEE